MSEKNNVDAHGQAKIRIGLMSYAMDHRQGKGTALYTRELIRHLLDDDRFEFTLIHYESVDDPLYRQANEQLIPPWIYPSRFLGQLAFFWRQRKEPFDIIQWFQPRLYPGYGFAPARYLIATIHGGGEFYYPFFSFSARMFDWVLKFANKKIDCAIVVTKTARQEAIETYGLRPERVAVTYNGGGERFQAINKEHALQTISSVFPQITRSFILNVSRLQPHKNIRNLLLGYFHLRETTTYTQPLVIVGWPTEKYEDLYALARGSAYASDIHFIDFVEDAHLNALYSAADIFVFPSLSEGFGIPLVEAMSAGTAVITSNRSCMPEVMGEAGLLANPTDPQDLARKMNDLLSQTDLRIACERRGLARAKLFTWAKTAEATKKIYLDLMQHGKLTNPEP